jgi:hypothetical protein
MLKAAATALWLVVLAGLSYGQKIEAAKASGPAELLYLGLRSVGLDRHRVYRIREAALDRGAIHISLDNGTIAFAEDVGGRITGAFFKGNGEILLAPPNTTERASLALFTGSPILEESFSAAYFRFNDDLYEKLKPFFRAADDSAGFVDQWSAATRALAEQDALRLLVSFIDQPDGALSRPGPGVRDPFWHVFFQGNRLGAFDVRSDAFLAEQICVGQHRDENGQNYYDVWASFLAGNSRHSDYGQPIDTAKPDFAITRLKIQARIKPPTELDTNAVLTISPSAEGRRVLLLELSRLLEVKAVRADGRPVEFIHNQAIEGSQLARRGNDLIAVIFPAPLTPGRQVELSFDYNGAVLSEAANGLLYVGERGTWYPNQGFQMATFDLEFRYPLGWTLVATGRRTQEQLSGGGEQVSRWESERPIPVAGFNLGKYSRTEIRAGQVPVVAYATAIVERDFPHTAVEVAPAVPPGLTRNRPIVPPLLLLPKAQLPPSPSQNAAIVAATAAQALAFYQQRFGAFPFSELKLTQSPGKFSQGWPGLIFLSSYAFLNSQERAELQSDPKRRLVMEQVVAHETAHQWWGDLVTWRDYRDQWIMEALANYSSLMLLESKSAADFHQVLEKFRDDLLAKNSKGLVTMNAGPVTLGIRLSCSQFPGAYEVISYERGTWLLHMLRTMLRDAEPAAPAMAKKSSDERFLRTLARLRADYQGKEITTAQLIALFEAELPPSVWYEGHRSLEWFYNSWVNGTAIPAFALKDVKLSSKVRGTTVTGALIQDHSPQDLVTSVPLYGSVAGKNVFIGRVFAEGHETQFRLSAPAGVRKILIDPEQTLLARAK